MSHKICLLSLGFFLFVTIVTGSDNVREGKVFSLFNVIQFKNEPCSSTTTLTSGESRAGLCYTASECDSRGGSAQGGCASGFGVCCVFISSNEDDNGRITNNCSYIQNPGYPMQYTDTDSSIQYTVEKSADDICQLRLDFESFTIAGLQATSDTDSAGNAELCKDTFAVTTNTNQLIPVICGTNNGEHMYINMGNEPGDSVKIDFTFNLAISVSRTWDIKVTQIQCGVSYEAPSDCLQYFTGVTGTIKTFNFEHPNDNHPPNQEYSSCVRREEGFCCVEYSICTGTTFQLGGNGAENAMQDEACVQDYISVPNSASTCSQGGNNVSYKSKYCGGFFTDIPNIAGPDVPICSCTPPFMVQVHTDVSVDTPPITINSKGACLTYKQIPCT